MNFIETIAVSHREAQHIKYHQSRLNWTLESQDCDPSDLDIELYVKHRIELQKNSPLLKSDDLIRCRVLYTDRHFMKCEFFNYSIHPVHSLQLVDGINTDYYFKYENRSDINELLTQKGKADDILIVKNGLLSDTSIGNIALWNGQEWHTPSEPLLRGTTRQRLIDEKKIIPHEISREELENYFEISIFNALIPFKTIRFNTRHIFPLKYS